MTLALIEDARTSDRGFESLEEGIYILILKQCDFQQVVTTSFTF